VSLPNFDQFFERATGNQPFDYQRRFAGGNSGSACQSRLIDIPTGLGKTAAVVLAWLWNRVELNRPDWPRRLVYCLPMRTLVEQTAGNTRLWLKKHHLSEAVGLHVLMGGEEAKDWHLEPERPAILIGTQDMLLSRALNRGYGMSRYRWPMDFGLLNNDCLWVLDETQLMGPGLATACQLEAFRLQGESVSTARFDSYPEGRSVTWYASATANREHLETRDWRGSERPETFFFGLSDEEKLATTGMVAERRLATKSVVIEKTWSFGEKAPAAERIEGIIEKHKQMTAALKAAPAELPRRTLIICNTVDRAVAVHDAIKAKLADDGEINILLMHSRFRPKERMEQVARLDKPNVEQHHGGQIIVATQVIEAGVDLSSAILWTEIAPLACLVQRFGRLNRSAEFGFNNQVLHGFTPQAIVVGIEAPDPESNDLKTKEKKDKAKKEAELKHLPYEKAKCDAAWIALEKLTGDASPASLEKIKTEVGDSIDRCPYSLQQHELLDFFDTDANLSLGFTDVSPFVRGIDQETDLYVAWREWPDSDKSPGYSADFQRQELCPVSIGKAKAARAAVLSKGWVWRGKDAGWESVRGLDVVPGMTILLPTTAGGYREVSGWTGEADDKPVTSVYEPSEMPSDEEMLSSLENGWQSIAQHTNDVTIEWERIADALEGTMGLSPQERSAILTATHWHDLGKNHPSWQSAAETALKEAGIDISADVRPIAKFSLSESPGLTGNELRRELTKLRRSFTPGLAHEVASALAFRQSETAHGTQRPIESLLAEYLIMSHHGRVRKVLRDEIPRHPKNEKDIETVRGIANGDALAAVTIAGQELQCASLSTDCRRMGRDDKGNESYTKGVLRLLTHYGPFRLAFLEALFRAADIQASIRAGKSTPTVSPQ